MENEKRLIDANALKQMFDKREADDIEMYGGVHIVECFPADDAKEIVDKCPTVDAVEVVHSRWDGSICMNCQENLSTWADAWYETPYCPNCGAKMDEGDSDDVCYMVEHYGVDIEEDRQEYDCHQFQAKTNCVEVVRCKDCKHYEEQEMRCDHPEQYAEYCSDCFLCVKPDDYCSYGEKREV